MSYQVIARRYRPQELDELIGQEHVRQTLLNALKSNRLHHALIFSGPRGTGKTSTARILAKTIRCPNAVDYVPCHTCKECQDIAAGRSLDVIEIDGASHNGVDSVRELRDSVGFMPSSGTKKIYIIDEVHMLSTSAFNALLKTLEEPPAHVLFIFATTEIHKLPATILSRCQRFDFRRIPTKVIAEHLAKICAQEKITAEPEALWSIARLADGSMRDSQSLLDQSILFTNSELTAEKVQQVLGLIDRNLLFETLSSILNRNHDQLLTILNKLLDSGFDPKVFVQSLLEQVRNLLILQTFNSKQETLIDLADSEVAQLKTLSGAFSNEDLHLLFDMTLKGANDIARSNDPLLVLEMLLLRMAEAPRIQDLAQMMKAGPSMTAAPRVAPARATAAVSPTASLSKTSAPRKSTSGTSSMAQSNARASISPVYDDAPMPTEENSAPAQSRTSTVEVAQRTPAVTADSPTEIRWKDVVEKIKAVNGMIGAQLENCSLIDTQNGKVVLGVPEKLKFLYDKLNQPDFKKKVANYLATFWGEQYQIEVQISGAEVVQAAPTPKQVAEKQETVRQDEVKKQIEAHPFVQNAKKMFKAEIKSIKEYKP